MPPPPHTKPENVLKVGLGAPLSAGLVARDMVEWLMLLEILASTRAHRC